MLAAVFVVLLLVGGCDRRPAMAEAAPVPVERFEMVSMARFHSHRVDPFRVWTLEDRHTGRQWLVVTCGDTFQVVSNDPAGRPGEESR